jgi:hypothetical protein
MLIGKVSSFTPVGLKIICHRCAYCPVDIAVLEGEQIGECT